MRRRRSVNGFLPLVISLLLMAGHTAAASEASIDAPPLALDRLGTTLTLHVSPSDSVFVHVVDTRDGATLWQRGMRADASGVLSVGPLSVASGKHRLEVQIAGQAPLQVSVRVLPGWTAVLPPVVAIVLAILLRQVVLALFTGLVIGAFLVHDLSLGTALLRAVDTYLVGSMSDPDNASVLLFTLMLGGMVGVIGRSGGAQGIATSVTRFATTPRRGQLSTWMLGLLVFFDDYANTLLVGPTMRPITDRLRVSREKLAFLVDCTSAPVASLALVSSWIGVEVGYIQAEFRSLALDEDAYLTFVRTLPYRFYPILMLFFVLLLVLLKRDFGPMHRAEMRSRHTGALLAPGATPATDFEADTLSPVEGKQHHWGLAALPLLGVLTTVLIGLWVTGHGAAREAGDALILRNIVGSADSYRALLWGAFVGSLIAIGMAVLTRVLSIADTMLAWVQGLRSVLFALVILVLAWSLGSLCKGPLQTGAYLVSILESTLRPAFLPLLVFLVAAFTSFATGSSWGTMGILFPLVIPLAHGLSPEDSALMLGAISGILAGSVWGDHCSPISDTTILSSMASSCDHIDHVRTQLPYAILVGAIAMLLGDLPTGLGWYGPWTGLVLGAAALTAIVLAISRRVPQQPED
jgi:Na+/H+ antiporter NhaC